MCGYEQLEPYIFMAKFLIKHEPDQSLSTVAIVVRDGMFDQDNITKMGFTQVTFVLDHWHLMNSCLRKNFCDHGHNLLQSHLVHIVESASESVGGWQRSFYPKSIC